MLSKRSINFRQKRGATVEYSHRPIAGVQAHVASRSALPATKNISHKPSSGLINDIAPKTKLSAVAPSPSPVTYNMLPNNNAMFSVKQTPPAKPKPPVLHNTAPKSPIPNSAPGKPKMFDVKPPLKIKTHIAIQAEQPTYAQPKTTAVAKTNIVKPSTNTATQPILPRRLDFTSPQPAKPKRKFRRHINKLNDIPSLPLPSNNVFKRSLNWLKNISIQRKISYSLALLVFIVLTVLATLNISNQASVSGGQDNYGSTAGSGESSLASSAYDEVQPTAQAVSRYTVADTVPKIIRVSSLGIFARTIRVGSDVKTGEIGMPKNIYDTGWYEASARPGEDGAVLLDGYSYGPNTPGIFENLSTIAVGSALNITTGNDNQYGYKVVSLAKTNSKTIDISKLIKPIDTAKQGLNILAYSAKGGKVSDEVLVVYAVREN